ncbi:hypothetical protein ABI59_06780 [Acidobacteria bacterium Mor1]|nr:hypothetical protein ABI59_06780 [Acidobacteria bacterium Mor1]
MAAADRPAIEVRDVSLSIARTPVLEEVSFTVAEGSFLGIIGPNGGGKSVLLRVMLGLWKPDRGSVAIYGEPPERARGDVAYLPQQSSFDRSFPITVCDVVLMGRLGNRGLTRRYDDADRARAAEAMERMEVSPFADRQIGRLSGGQLQRVLIARALAMDARILMLDEPNAALDSHFGGRLYPLLKELSETMTVVLVAHDVALVSQYVDSIACLNRRVHFHPAGGVTPEMLEHVYGYAAAPSTSRDGASAEAEG